jgi:hypothetical protein
MKRTHTIIRAVLCCLGFIELLGPAAALAQSADISARNDVIEYTAKAKALGGQFAWQTSLPAVNSSLTSEAGPKLGGTSYADASVRSVALEWNWGRANSGIAYTFTAPTGRDAPGIARDMFSEYLSNDIVSGTSFYLGKDKDAGTVASLTTDWESWGQEQRAKGSCGMVGQSFTMEWGVTHILPLNYQRTRLLEVGVAGYDEWLHSNGAALLPGGLPTDSTPLSVHAIGFQTNFLLPAKNLRLSFKYEPEYLRYAHAPSPIMMIDVSWTW